LIKFDANLFSETVINSFNISSKIH